PQAGRPPGCGVPRVVIGPQHPARAAPVRLEGEESVPRADVQHRLAAEIPRELDPVELLRRVALEAGSDEVVAQADRVEPADPLDLVSERVARHPADD